MSRALADTSASRLSPTQLNQLTAAYICLLKAMRDPESISAGPLSRLRPLALRLWSAADATYSLRVAPESLQNRLHMICSAGGAAIDRDGRLAVVSVAAHLLQLKADQSNIETKESLSPNEQWVNPLINATTVEGFTPIMLAAANGHSELVSFLVSQRASVSACSHERRLTPSSASTALQFAAKNGTTKLIYEYYVRLFC